MKRRSAPDLLLLKATQDEEVLDAAVLTGIKISDAVFGFHAQQAVEKLLSVPHNGSENEIKNRRIT